MFEPGGNFRLVLRNLFVSELGLVTVSNSNRRNCCGSKQKGLRTPCCLILKSRNPPQETKEQWSDGKKSASASLWDDTFLIPSIWPWVKNTGYPKNPIGKRKHVPKNCGPLSGFRFDP